MAELFPTRAAMELQGASIADGMRNTMLFIRKLRDDGYEVGPKGLGIIEGLIFAQTAVLDDYLDQVKALSTFLETFAGKSRSYVKSVEVQNAEITELTGCVRGCLKLLSATTSNAETRDLCGLISDAIGAIEDRTVRAEPATAQPGTVVQLFPQRGNALEGGAA